MFTKVPRDLLRTLAPISRGTKPEEVF